MTRVAMPRTPIADAVERLKNFSAKFLERSSHSTTLPDCPVSNQNRANRCLETLLRAGFLSCSHDGAFGNR